MKIFKRILIVFFILIGIIIIGVGGYVGYVAAQYYRIEDNLDLEVNNKVSKNVSLDTEYKISSYNIGFGAYLQDYTFFMDTGYMPDGTPVGGTESRAKSKESVLFSTNGAINTINSYNPDFAFFQEVDIKAHRSHKVNQYEMIKEQMPGYTTTFANNFHSAYLMYPLTKPHGAVEAGIATMSKYEITSAVRKSFTVSDDFISKISDLDRCFSASYLPIDGSDKELVLVNIHTSAYDEGGVIRAKQMEELNTFLNSENDKGNYIVCGGDFNHDLLTNNPDFDYRYKEGDSFDNSTVAFKDQFKQPKPDWLQFIFENKKKANSDEFEITTAISDNFKVVASDNSPSCRTCDVTWQPGFTYVATLDGFIVSNNVEVIAHKNLVTTNPETNLKGFAYADHEPATMTFKLK